MNTEIKKRWVEALRSGKYSQTTGMLKTGDRYCCLGVLCDLYRQQHPGESEWYGDIEFNVGAYNSCYVLITPVMQWSGLPDRKGLFDGGMKCLSGMNDGGSTFSEIADIIEKNF